MHQLQVREVCGDPAAERPLDFTMRRIEPARRHRLSGYYSGLQYRGPAYSVHEVAVTGFAYNFEPRKFIRRLVFEGGLLVSMETGGYSYRQRGK